MFVKLSDKTIFDTKTIVRYVRDDDCLTLICVPSNCTSGYTFFLYDDEAANLWSKISERAEQEQSHGENH